MEDRAILQVESLVKTYPDKTKGLIKAVDGVSLTVRRGELVGLLGPNGAGKTTTVKMICGLIRPDQGRILIDGIDPHINRNLALGKISAVLEGNRNIYWRLTVRENLEFFSAIKGQDPRRLRAEIDYYIDYFGLRDKEREEARKLSRGMQQKLAIAVAMVTQSTLILLDEPTLGLDVKASYEIRELLRKIVKQDGRTVVLTTHDMNVVQDTCERVVIVNHGKVVAEDRITNLLDVFQMKVYQIKVQGALSDVQEEALAVIPDLHIERTEQGTLLTLRLAESDVLYRVISVLGQEGSALESIDRQENNFEKIFMEILERSDHDEITSVS